MHFISPSGIFLFISLPDSRLEIFVSFFQRTYSPIRDYITNFMGAFGKCKPSICEVWLYLTRKILRCVHTYYYLFYIRHFHSSVVENFPTCGNRTCYGLRGSRLPNNCAVVCRLCTVSFLKPGPQ